MARQRHISAVLSLRDNMSATLRGVRREQSAFRQDVQNTRRSLERNLNRRHTLRINNTAAMRAIDRTRTALEPLRRRVVVAAAYRDMITSRIRATTNKLKVLGKTIAAPVVKIKDKTTAFFSKIKNNFLNLKTLAAGVIAGIGVSKIIGSGAELEKQIISMEHFIGVNNKDLDTSGVKEISDAFLKELRNNAKVTPFSSSEVIAAGTRALGITSGDTKEAMELVKIAEDMAALTPGKTIEMAMEALADAKNGEMERLKEFNAKVSAEEFQKLGFMGVVDKKLKSQFEGGAQKLSKSASGMWATVTGGISATLQELGLSVIEKLAPHLQSFVSWMDASGPTIDLWAGRIATGIGWAIDKIAGFANSIKQYMPMAKEIVGNVVNWISDKFKGLSGNVGFLKEYWSSAWSGIKEVIKTGWDFINPIIDLLINGVKLAYEAFEFSFPAIKNVVSGVWDFIKPLLEGMGGLIDKVASGVGKVADWLSEKNSNRKNKTTVDGSHYNGLKSVPFDGYTASLHKGEAVIPAKYNPFNGGNTATTNSRGSITINIYAQDKSTKEIVNELVPQLKLALENT